MVILAIYYTIADLVLLGQCFYYRGFTLCDDVAVNPAAPSPPSPPVKPKPRTTPTPTERTALLDDHHLSHPDETLAGPSDWTHLSPAVPLVTETQPPPPPTRLQVFGFNLLATVMVCAAGVVGWWLSRTYRGSTSGREPDGPADGGADAPGLVMSFWGQVFGWLCAALYLGSRLPQLLLNWRRKSTDGVSMLFFLFACLGNLTYVLSILAFEPDCDGAGGDDSGVCDAGQMYWRYILLNLSWLAGSAGTLALDFAIFVQFFLYSKADDDDDEGESDLEDGSTADEEGSIDGREREVRWDQRPILERTVSDFS